MQNNSEPEQQTNNMTNAASNDGIMRSEHKQSIHHIDIPAAQWTPSSTMCFCDGWHDTATIK